MAKRRSTTPAFHMVKRRRRQYVQHGGNFPVFRAMQSQQRGYGLGGMFRSLFRTVTPHLKKGLAHVGRRALTAGANALADMSANNTSLKDALKKQVKNEITALNPINRLQDLMSAPRKGKATTLNRTPKNRRKGTRKGSITI